MLVPAAGPPESFPTVDAALEPMSQVHTERRMALLFLAVLALLVWQSTRLERLRPSPIRFVVAPGSQVYPVAVPPGAPPELPAEPAARWLELVRRSVAWPGRDETASTSSDCALFVPVSPHHWARRPVDASELARFAGSRVLPGEPVAGRRFALAPRDLLDDDDRDGELLDADELAPPAGATGLAVELLCSPEAVGGTAG